MRFLVYETGWNSYEALSEFIDEVHDKIIDMGSCAHKAGIM
jgi:hypothetical protein